MTEIERIRIDVMTDLLAEKGIHADEATVLSIVNDFSLHLEMECEYSGPVERYREPECTRCRQLEKEIATLQPVSHCCGADVLPAGRGGGYECSRCGKYARKTYKQ